MKLLIMMVLLLASGSSASAQSVAERLNDYPTSARADYVFGCMAANGQGQDVLIKCSCSIDHIATILPYEKYVEAETVLSLRLAGGERMAIFRTAASTNALVADLRRAQAEAEILCF
jgi:lysyl-tRNA synthetase class II